MNYESQQVDEAAAIEAPAVSEAPPAADAHAASSSGPDDLDHLLAEFDQNASRGTGAEPAADGGADGYGSSDDQAAQHEHEGQLEQQRVDELTRGIDLANRDAHTGQLQSTIEQLQQRIQAEAHHQFLQAEHKDFERLASEAQDSIKHLDVADNFADRWLTAEAMKDPRLQSAWAERNYEPPNPLERAEIERAIYQRAQELQMAANRIPDRLQRHLAERNIAREVEQMRRAAFPDPVEHRALAKRYIADAVKRMRADAKRRLDPEATADRLMVAEAVRGASGRASADPPPNLGKMSDREFNNFTKQWF